MNADPSLEHVRHDVQIVFAGDDDVPGLLAGFVEELDLFDIFATLILDFPTGAIDD